MRVREKHLYLSKYLYILTIFTSKYRFYLSYQLLVVCYSNYKDVDNYVRGVE